MFFFPDRHPGRLIMAPLSCHLDKYAHGRGKLANPVPPLFNPGVSMSSLVYLQGYPESLLDQVRTLIAEQRLDDVLQKRYPHNHNITSDRALYDYTLDLKNQSLRNAPPLNKVFYDNKIRVMKDALGLHTAISRVQGGRLKAKAEIRVATLFKQAPEAFLRMIVVHELAHIKEKNHSKAFYQLCCHMEPQYHQLEFDTRLWLTARALENGAAE